MSFPPTVLLLQYCYKFLTPDILCELICTDKTHKEFGDTWYVWRQMLLNETESTQSWIRLLETMHADDINNIPNPMYKQILWELQPTHSEISTRGRYPNPNPNRVQLEPSFNVDSCDPVLKAGHTFFCMTFTSSVLTRFLVDGSFVWTNC